MSRSGLPDTYREQDSCQKCGHCEAHWQYAEDAQYLCKHDMPPEPIRVSCPKNPMPLAEMSPEQLKSHHAFMAYQHERDVERVVLPSGICDYFTAR